MKIAIVWSMGGPKSWNAHSLEPGIGGSEAMIILRAKELVKLGHTVECYAPGNTPPVQIQGVTWRSLPTWPFSTAENYNFKADVLVSLRRAGWKNGAKLQVLWANDHGCFDLEDAVKRGECNSIFTISQFQKDWYHRQYPTIPVDNFIVSSAGVETSFYNTTKAKNPKLCIYTSTPERGLQHLIQLWRVIRKRVKDAELVVTGGFELYGVDPKRAFEMSSGLYSYASYLPNTTVAGVLKRSELAALQKHAALLIYPCIYDEMCCISALEASAAGCAIVATERGALEERVVDGTTGYLIPGLPGTPAHDDLFVDRVVELLEDSDKRSRMGAAGKEAVQCYDHAVLAKQWVEYFEKGLQ